MLHRQFAKLQLILIAAAAIGSSVAVLSGSLVGAMAADRAHVLAVRHA